MNLDFFDKEAFNSRLEAFKTPYGAVPSGTKVTLRLKPRRSCGTTGAVLCAKFEFDDDRITEVPMTWVALERDRDVYTAELDTGDYIGLVWYSFRLEYGEGKQVQSLEHQLTVYDDSDKVPDWFGRGTCYQIFPDRFCRLSIPDPTGMVGGRSVHQKWDEEPIEGPIGKNNIGKDICNRDFFGGSLKGVESKLDYIASLGVETIYFCPIFEASENHRYGTADYSRIDPMLGDEEDFRRLCREAHKRGMKIILDGVFNHTGYVSRYFNGDGFYPTPGASQSKDSPYYSWFQFKKWPKDYESWWGIYSLPAVEETDPAYRKFIFGGEDSVVRRWLKAGADGWRLDVADELPDDFVAGIHQAVRETDPNDVVIGEVWEDGTTKISYNVRRKHLLGGHLDGLMNYPFRTACIDYLLGRGAEYFVAAMEELRENYPPTAFYSAMNSLGTHDTLRIITYLGMGSKCEEKTKAWRGSYTMTAEQRKLGGQRLKLGAEILFTFPGAPTVYYGDEIGMEGFEDPFNRRTYPWGREDEQLLKHFRRLGALRKSNEALRSGTLKWGPCRKNILSFYRSAGEQTVCTVINAGEKAEKVTLVWNGAAATDALTGKVYPVKNSSFTVELDALEGRIFL